MVIKKTQGNPARLEDEIDILHKMGLNNYEINCLLYIKSERYEGGDD